MQSLRSEMESASDLLESPALPGAGVKGVGGALPSASLVGPRFVPSLFLPSSSCLIGFMIHGASLFLVTVYVARLAQSSSWTSSVYLYYLGFSGSFSYLASILDRCDVWRSGPPLALTGMEDARLVDSNVEEGKYLYGISIL